MFGPSFSTAKLMNILNFFLPFIRLSQLFEQVRETAAKRHAYCASAEKIMCRTKTGRLRLFHDNAVLYLGLFIGGLNLNLGLVLCLGLNLSIIIITFSSSSSVSENCFFYKIYRKNSLQ